MCCIEDEIDTMTTAKPWYTTCFINPFRRAGCFPCFSYTDHNLGQCSMPADFYRAILCIRGTSHGPVSVCVCLSQVGVLLKRLNVGSHKQHRTIIQDSSFRMPKISAKFHRDHPLRGRQMQVGWVKIGDFRQIAGYISKTVQDRRMVSIKVEWEVVCALSNGAIADDLEWPISAPQLPQFVHFAPPFIASQRVNLETLNLVH